MKNIWSQHYQEGVPEEIGELEYHSLNELFIDTFNKYKKLPAFSNMGTTMTFEQLDKKTLKFAAFLQAELGLQKGERFAVMMPNIMQYPVAMIGIHRAGGVVVNVNPQYTVPELEHQLRDSGATGIIVLDMFANTAKGAIAEVNKGAAEGEEPIKHVIVTHMGDGHKFPKSLIVDYVVKNKKKLVPEWSFDQYHEYSESLKTGKKVIKDHKLHGERVHYHDPDLAEDDIAFLQYTGGTTGPSKGAVLTHRNILSNIAQASAVLKPQLDEYSGSTKQQTIITALPLYHIFSLMANCLTFMQLGGKNVLITNPRDIPGFVKELQKHDFTFITGVNTLYNALLNDPNFQKMKFKSLKIALGGGAPVQEEVATRWQEVTRTPLLPAYGLTECSPAVSIPALDSKSFTDSVGLPLPSTEISIRDLEDEDTQCGLNEPGELWVRGPQVMQGYWQKQEETDKVITKDGWLKTGDLATLNDEGLLSIVGRKKEMILVSGFNVYPDEIEGVMAKMPGILEISVVGTPSKKTGEQVVACVVLQPDSYLANLDKKSAEKAIKEYCRENLTGYKQPREIHFWDELPKSPIGKILRRKVRQELLGEDALKPKAPHKHKKEKSDAKDKQKVEASPAPVLMLNTQEKERVVVEVTESSNAGESAEYTDETGDSKERVKTQQHHKKHHKSRKPH